MAELDRDAIRGRHKEIDMADAGGRNYCDKCLQSSPCDAIQLCDEVELRHLAILKLAGETEELSVKNDRLREALQKIIDWADAYPVDVFPEPDLEYVARALKQAAESTDTHGPISLDCVSASNMRHCLKGAKRIARAALHTEAAAEPAQCRHRVFGDLGEVTICAICGIAPEPSEGGPA